MVRRVLLVCVAIAVACGSAAGCAMPDRGPQRAGAPVFRLGDCVEIPSTAPDPLTARKVDCAVDPSYTVGAVANASGACPSIEYQHLAAKYADPATARLCLVPNLVADHCYVLDVPIGAIQKADCAQRGQQGLLVQVTQRLDVHDQKACRAGGRQYAWPYPSPPRTYCTLTVF